MEHPYGWLSLLPPVVAIVLAMATRRILVSLLAGIFVGALITTGGRPFRALEAMLEIHLWKTLIDEDKLRVFAFTLLMGAMVGVINASGGMRGLVEAISPFASTRRRGQLTVWFLGLCIFFDDYANTVLLGGTMRRLCDRLRISREKLAYLVDSTAAPVAGLALVSTWVAGEISYVADGLAKVPGGDQHSAIDLFIASIPYRFYVLWALVFVALVAILRRDFGPMLAAERGQLPAGSAEPAGNAELESDAETVPARWYNAVVPVAVTIGVLVWLLYATGIESLGADQASAPSLREVFGAADAYYALLYGSLAGFVTAAAMTFFQRLLPPGQIVAAAGDGARLMLFSLAILWLASALSNMTGKSPYPGDDAKYGDLANASYGEGAAPASKSSDAKSESAGGDLPLVPYRLYTGDYLGGLIGDRLNPALLPTIVFILSGLTAFATGTSWGTMGIVMPMVVPIAYAAAGDDPANSPVLLASVGSVLAGAIFGDHCSPISDTTILSSQSSGCDHMAHVWTQLPYALLVAGVAILFGTLPAGFGVPVWPLLLAGCIVLAAILWFGGDQS